MQTLTKLYEKISASNKLFLMKCLFNMKIEEGGSIVDNLNEFNIVTSQLSSVSINFEDGIRGLLILCPLPERWNDLLMVLFLFLDLIP